MRIPFSEGIDVVNVGLKVHYHATIGQFEGPAMSSNEVG